MGYLAMEIVGLLAGAAALGFVIGWAIFWRRAPKVATAPSPKLDADLKAATDARKKAEMRILELESKELNYTERLTERDTKIAELSHLLDDQAKYRVEAAAEREGRDHRITALETQLEQAEAARAAAAAAPSAPAPEAATAAPTGTSAADAAKIVELQAEISELRATLVATAGLAPTTTGEKDVMIARLNEEVTGLRAAYEAAEQALEEQDQAIDKLTRDYVSGQQRIAQLEGRDYVPAKPVVSVALHRPVVTAPSMGAATVLAAPVIETNEATVALSVADILAKVDAESEAKHEPPPMPPVIEAEAPPEPPTPPPIAQAEPDESTVAVSLADLLDRVDREHPPASAHTEPAHTEPAHTEPAHAEPPHVAAPEPATTHAPAASDDDDGHEATVAVALADLVDQIDRKAAPVAQATPVAEAAPVAPVTTTATTPPPMPPADDYDEDESSAESFSELVGRMDQRTGPSTPTMPTPPGPPPGDETPGDDLGSESTVALSLADLVLQIDQKVPRSHGAADAAHVESEATVALELPDELLDDDDDIDHKAPAGSDDLKRIKGIGPATEKRLNGAGITRWAQVASLRDTDLPAIADLLKVSVDKIKPWVEQAKALEHGHA